MTDYLPDVYTSFQSQYPEVSAALGDLAGAVKDIGDLSASSARLVKLGIAIGAGAEGSVRSNVRRALEAGVPAADIRQCGLLAITTVGFPAAIAAMGWISEVLDSA